MRLLKSNKNKGWGVGRPRVIVLGVTHIEASIPQVLAVLERLTITEETTVFIEPRRPILLGEEICAKGPIQQFFTEISRHLLLRGAVLVPLNPKKMPSHEATDLVGKYAHQFAEEEYMTDITASVPFRGTAIVIIGDVHAGRIAELLGDKGLRARYQRIGEITPDDIFLKAWRNALEGKTDEYLDMAWLRAVNMQLAAMMEKEGVQRTSVQESCWDDEKKFAEYLINAKTVMASTGMKQYLRRISEDIRLASAEVKTVGKEILLHYASAQDHIPLTRTK